jgi:hypothetical protein
MSAQFKRIHEDSVICTAEGCAKIAAFYLRYQEPFQCESVAAYCELHAEEAAKRLKHPWPITEENCNRFPIERETVRLDRL